MIWNPETPQWVWNMRRFCQSYDHEKFLPEFSMGWLDPYKEKWDLLEAATKK
jgi:hypothetical protein